MPKSTPNLLSVAKPDHGESLLHGIPTDRAPSMVMDNMDGSEDEDPSFGSSYDDEDDNSS